MNGKIKEKAILAGLGEPERHDGNTGLSELEELAYAANLDVAGKVWQNKTEVDPAYYLGRGKLEHIASISRQTAADVIIFDDELSGTQMKNIEDITGTKTIDRTMLILDIFARRAHSSEGKLQVELAQLRYRLLHLTGAGTQLSRLGGGIGTRGPGEKKLETDRRHIRRRVIRLEGELRKLGRRRRLIRENRKQNETPVIVLVGYTNAGKSTLMNRLCGTDVFVEDKLFATLDPTVRKLMLPDGRQTILIDTVGFIRKLPHELIEAFKSTLEEVAYADLLLHVADSSHEEADKQIAVVEDILQSLEVAAKPSILVLNKTDLGCSDMDLPPGRHSTGNRSRYDICEISAINGDGIQDLLDMITRKIRRPETEVRILIPYNEGRTLSFIHESAIVSSEQYTEEGIRITAVIQDKYLDRIKRFRIT